MNMYNNMVETLFEFITEKLQLYCAYPIAYTVGFFF